MRKCKFLEVGKIIYKYIEFVLKLFPSTATYLLLKFFTEDVLYRLGFVHLVCKWLPFYFLKDLTYGFIV